MQGLVEVMLEYVWVPTKSIKSRQIDLYVNIYIYIYIVSLKEIDVCMEMKGEDEERESVVDDVMKQNNIW